MPWTEKQVEAFGLLSNPSVQQAALLGGSGSGKSYVVGHKIRQRANEFPGSLQIILRKTMADCRDTVWSTMMLNRVLKGDIANRHCTEYKQPAKVVYKNGSEIRIGGLHPSEIDKVLGPDYATIWPNEASEIAWANVPPLRTRLRDRSTHREHKGFVKPMLVFDFNPPTVRHWTHKVFIEGIDPDSGEPLPDREKWAWLRMNPYDNRANLDPNYLQTLESMSEGDKRRFLRGEFGQLKGLVYATFDPELNIYDIPPIDAGCRFFRAFDFGFVNPFVCLWGMLASDDTLYITAERYLAKVTVDIHAQEVKALTTCRIEQSWADHDSGEVAQLQKFGDIHTIPAIKDVKAGINLTNGLIEKRKIKVHRSCQNLINEFQSYKWKDGNKDEVVKEHDHAMDALRYLVMGIFSAPSKPEFFSAR